MLGVVVGVLLAVDVATRLWSEAQVEAAARKEVPEASVSADVDGFPFVPPLVASGRVDHVDLVLRNVGVDRFRFDRLAFSFEGVEVSRRALFREGEVELIDIERGTITAEISLGVIGEVLGRQLPEGAVDARLVGRSIELRIGGADLTIPLPRPSLLPCEGDVRLEGQRLFVSCTVHDVPPGLVEAVSQDRR